MRRPIALFAGALGLVASLVAVGGAGAASRSATLAPHDGTTCAWMGPTGQALPPVLRATELASAMSLSQEIAFLNLGWSAVAENVTTPIPSLCLPSFAFQDGPNGVALLGGEALPAEIAVGATFDPAAATLYGQALGAAGALRGDTAVQGPTLNLGVWPAWGRNAETFGEDPALAGLLGTAEVAGVQSTGTGVIIKHFGIYLREQNRGAAQLDTSDRALQEVFLAPFAPVIAQDNPLAVMCAFGHYNGTLQCASPLLSNRLAQMGFTGFVRTDLAATTNPAPSLSAGVSMFKTSLAPAMAAEVASGALDPSVINDRVVQVLTALFAHGYMDHPPTLSTTLGWTTQERQASTTVGSESIVLLKNNGILPLASSTHLTVIGGAATLTEALTEGGSSEVAVRQPANFLTPLIRRFGTKNVSYAQASPTAPVTTIALPTTSPGPTTYSSTYVAPTAGNYVVQLRATTGNSAATVTIDGHLAGQVALANTSGFAQSIRATYLTAGSHDVVVRYRTDGTVPDLQIQNVDAALAQASAAAASADVPVVFVSDQEGEQDDRSTLSLNGYQNLLVQAVAAANPRTVVVIEAGGPVLTPWASKVAAIVDVWYPGQVAGWPLAGVLAGDIDPSGHLPITFPASDQASPLGDPSYQPNGVVQRLFGPSGTGLDWGMHYYAATKQAVAYPFGFGLSYTTFSAKGLTIASNPTGWTLTATVQNTGKVAGRAVLQAYVTFPADAGEPANQLKAIGQATLAPGAKTTVTMAVPRTALQIWPNGAPIIQPGTYTVAVGQSSADLGLSSTFSVR